MRFQASALNTTFHAGDNTTVQWPSSVGRRIGRRSKAIDQDPIYMWNALPIPNKPANQSLIEYQQSRNAPGSADPSGKESFQI